MSTTSERFLHDLDEQAVQIPDELREELRQLCLAPLVFVWQLEDRVIAGNRVLDKYGGIDAPDWLWARWVAIFTAWHRCWIDLKESERKPRRTREYRPKPTPTFSFNTNHQKGTNP